jgi:hypothetical protein
MAITTTISTKELQRQAALVFEGETIKVMLCQVGLTGYTAESTVANWQSVEVSGNGYVRYSEVISTGSYSGSAGAYVLPIIDAEFTSTGAGYNYDTVVIYIDGATYPHSVLTEDPNIVLLGGQTQTYRITLTQDD